MKFINFDGKINMELWICRTNLKPPAIIDFVPLIHRQC